MVNSVYETHIMHPQLPFIFHKDSLRNRTNYSQGYANWHRNIELLCCTEGEGIITCNGKPYPLHPGDTLVIHSDTVHSCHAVNRVVYHCLIIESSFCTDNGLDIESLCFQPQLRDPQICATFERIAQAYAQQAKEPSPANILTIRREVLGILCTLYTHYRIPDTALPHSPNDLHIKAAITFIRKNLAEVLTLEEIARQAGISKFHLSREFKRITGSTVFEFINLTRCSEARYLIETGTPVSAAAQACGYENMSYFTRVFKRQFGLLPSSLLNRQNRAEISPVK